MAGGLTAAQLAALRATGPGTADAVGAYLEARRRVLVTVLAGALTGDGTTQLVLSGAGARCASCHARWITVWDVERQAPLWEGDGGVDTVVALTPDGRGLERSDSVWLDGEPRCCPSRRVAQTLFWDGGAFVVAEATLMDARRG